MIQELRINIKFCFKLQKSAKETHEMLKSVYGDAAVTMKTVYKWFERFRNGCEYKRAYILQPYFRAILALKDEISSAINCNIYHLLYSCN